MYSLQSHYYDVVQRDLILSEHLSATAKLPKLEKLTLCLGGNSLEERYVLGCLAALKIITCQTPYVTKQKLTHYESSSASGGVGGKLTLRGQKQFLFLNKLLFDVLPQIKQFEGLRAPAHDNVYCFVLKDVFVFQELVPLFPYFEDLSSLQCQFHFTTENKFETVILGNSLKLCFSECEK